MKLNDAFLPERDTTDFVTKLDVVLLRIERTWNNSDCQRGLLEIHHFDSTSERSSGRSQPRLSLVVHPQWLPGVLRGRAEVVP